MCLFDIQMFSRFLCKTGLDRNTEYMIRVQALTVNGSGPASSWAIAETFLHDLDGRFYHDVIISFAYQLMHMIGE